MQTCSKSQRSQRGKGCGGKTRQLTARPGCMGFPVHWRRTPELLGLMKGRKDMDQWTREGNRSLQGRGALLGPRPLSSSYGPARHWNFVRSEGLTLPGVWCREMFMLCPQRKVTPPCSLRSAHPLRVTRDLLRAAESGVGKVDWGPRPRLPCAM